MTDSAQSLEDIALDWVVLLNSGKATAEDQQAYQQWRALSEEHQRVTDDAQSLWAMLGHTPTARQFQAPQPASRRAKVWWPALAASVVLAVAGLVGWQQWPMLNSDYHTSVGQLQTVTLADGSKIILNSASAVSVAFSADERSVILRAGEALFEPAVEARPFVVRSGNELIQAGNGVFSVRREGDALTLVVSAGQVQLKGAHQPVLVQADQRLALQSGQPLLAQQKVDAVSLTAWQRGKLIFNGRPLGEVIGELERYQHGRILISDRELAALPVSGVFELNDPQGSLRTLEQRYPLKVTYLPWLAVLH
ncbi:FecR family protein [Pseudomonas vancouverensis]|uniref:FecR family protein n=1 Tax=Pseudomonas vancouverensis TaxID=95300 RepID=A0A1H2PD54_PSEVA|nr:FecR family protein [Pseudomonas vancouverensis]KAB0493750.1 FecR family protein [Pseudomonas vancouverensis]TDB67673.1 FecR family protein [Pseudomonas vancouverensis]SDV15235.1 FecR family protein [Pseudomonas vancouverensis]